MPRLTGPTSTGIAALMPYFNSIMGAVEQGLSTSGIWTAYRNAVALAGGELGQASIFDMNLMTGYARSILSAEQNFGLAPGANAIDSTMWAWAPWAAGQTDAWLTDRYQIRYQATMTGPDGTTTPIWGVDILDQPLEGWTVDQMLARANQSAQNALDSGSPRVLAQLGMAQDFTLSSIERVQIMRI